MDKEETIERMGRALDRADEYKHGMQCHSSTRVVISSLLIFCELTFRLIKEKYDD